MAGLLPTVALLAVTAVWGWTFVVVANAVAVYSVVGFLALRFVVATAVILPFAAHRLRRGLLLPGGGIGLLLAAGYLLQTQGLRFTAATNAGLITGLFVIVAPVASRILYRIRLRRSTWGAVALSVAGMDLLAGGGPTGGTRGDILILGGALAFGLHIAVLSRHAPRHDAAALTAVQMATVALVFAAAWPLTGPVCLPPTPVWRALAITGVLASAAGYGIQTWAQQHMSAARTALVLTAEPLFAALFGYLLAGDRLSPTQAAGGALIVAAVILAEITPTFKVKELPRLE